jgi:hypothetical protein
LGLADFLKQRTQALNPYFYGGSVIISRLKWDLRLESWRSRAKLHVWKNRFHGEKAVILCNGPSLLKSDLTLLEGLFTFGLNKIHLLFEKSKFRPSCVVSVNSLVIQQARGVLESLECPVFLDSACYDVVPPKDNVIFLHSTTYPGFARDCGMSVHQGYTVTYVALQLAFHMGFSRVALIGADHSYTAQGRPNETAVASGPDGNHFDPNYFSGGVKWQLPDLAGSERFYLLAREVFAGAGREIVNATEGGQLELFRREALERFVVS